MVHGDATTVIETAYTFRSSCSWPTTPTATRSPLNSPVSRDAFVCQLRPREWSAARFVKIALHRLQHYDSETMIAFIRDSLSSY